MPKLTESNRPHERNITDLVIWLGQTPEEDQAMRQKASHWFYKMIGAEDDDQKQ